MQVHEVMVYTVCCRWSTTSCVCKGKGVENLQGGWLQWRLPAAAERPGRPARG